MLGLGAWLVVAGHASPGIMIAATLLLGRALQPVEHLIAGWKSLVEVRGAWARLQQHAVDAPQVDDAAVAGGARRAEPRARQPVRRCAAAAADQERSA